jgi:hypothetical protein
MEYKHKTICENYSKVLRKKTNEKIKTKNTFLHKQVQVQNRKTLDE